MEQTELLIIGGGPAGMSAAIAAAEQGVRCCIVDEGTDLGGQLYRAPDPHARKAVKSLVHPRGDILRQRIAELSDYIEIRQNSVVWGIDADNKIAVGKDDAGTEFLRPKKIVIAAGAYEYVPPFPGWTLPGVMTPGAAQILAKSMDTIPVGRIVVAGSGPLLLAAAAQLLSKGGDVVGVIDASPRRAWFKLALAGLRTPGVFLEAIGYLRTLLRARVPVRFGHVVTRVQGDESIDLVHYAKVDRDWFPRSPSKHVIEADTLCIGYGLQPRSYLAQLAGCELEFDTAYSCWRAQRNDDMLTSREDIYTVGDSAGIRGSRVAEIEGRLAGLHAAVALGNTTTADVNHERKRLLRHKRRFEKFQRQLSRLCGVRPGLAALVKPDTLVCRCEEIRWREAQSAIEHGAHDFRTLKVMTRIGMGMCQARFCWPAMTRLIANHTGADIATIGPARPRPPVRPVPVEVIAEAAEAETTG